MFALKADVGPEGDEYLIELEMRILMPQRVPMNLRLGRWRTAGERRR